MKCAAAGQGACLGREPKAARWLDKRAWEGVNDALDFSFSCRQGWFPFRQGQVG